MPTTDKISAQLSTMQTEARSNIKGLLGRSPSFMSLPTNEQISTYKDLVDAEYNRLVDKSGLRAYARQQASGDAPVFDAVKNRADKMIGINDVGSSFAAMVGTVNFPEFVRDLVQAVYDANINLTREQMSMFSDMIAQVTGSLQGFINEISDADSMAFVAENSPDKYQMIMERGRSGQSIQVMVDAETLQKIDENDTELKAKMMDAKIKMAQERRLILRETILMGVSRIVITSGKVKARCNFKIDVADHLTGANSRNSEDNTHVSNENELGVKGGMFGWSATMKNKFKYQKDTKITVSTSSNIDSNQSAQAELMGEVELNFKSDYFKLDNFKELFPGANQLQQPGAAAPSNQTPAAPQQPSTR